MVMISYGIIKPTAKTFVKPGSKKKDDDDRLRFIVLGRDGT